MTTGLSNPAYVTATTSLVTSETGTSATFSVALNSEPTASVTINLGMTMSGEGSLSTSTLTFTAANWNVAQTVTVTGLDDHIVHGDQTYQITGTATSSDANYNGLSMAPVTVTNTEADTAGLAVTPTSGLVTTQAGGRASFSVALSSQPLNTVTVSVSSSDPTQGTPSVSTLTFTSANWNQAQTVTVSGQNNGIAGPDQPYSINLSAASGDANYSGATASVALTNLNEDQAGITVTPAAGLQTTQTGGQASFSVALSSQPLSNVTVSVNSSDPTQGTPSVSTLTFTSANWNQAQTVTVSGQNNSIAGPNLPYSINLSAASGDTSYNGATASVALTNLNENHAGITVTPVSGLQTTDAGGTAVFSVVLSSKPAGVVTVLLSSDNPAAGNPSQGSLSFNAANWNLPQTVTITGGTPGASNVGYQIVTAPATSADPAYAGLKAADVAVTNIHIAPPPAPPVDPPAPPVPVVTPPTVTTSPGGSGTVTVPPAAAPTSTPSPVTPPGIGNSLGIGTGVGATGPRPAAQGRRSVPRSSP